MAGVLALSLPFGVQAASTQEVQVVDPYLELHTGPGRGFPVFHVIEREQWIEIRRRRTDWFKVRSNKGVEGWVHRKQLEQTLTRAGVAATFRDVLVNDYLKRRAAFSIEGGVFAGDPLLSSSLMFLISEKMSIDLAYGQSAGALSSTTLVHGLVTLYHKPGSRVSPYMSLGIGQLKNVPNATLIGAVTTESVSAMFRMGVDFYLSRRFVGRVAYQNTVAFVDSRQMEEHQAVTLGVAVFF